MGPIWVLLAPGEPHVGPMNLAIRVCALCVHVHAWRNEAHLHSSCFCGCNTHIASLKLLASLFSPNSSSILSTTVYVTSAVLTQTKWNSLIFKYGSGITSPSKTYNFINPQCSSFYSCLAKPQSRFANGWVIKSHRKQWSLITYPMPNLRQILPPRTNKVTNLKRGVGTHNIAKRIT